MSPTFGQGISSRRIWAVGIGFALLLMLGLARFFQLQVLQHDTWLKRKDHERRRYEITAARGVILDRDAEVLARDAPCTSLFAEPRRMRDPASTAAVLASELAVSADMLKERFFRHGGFVWLARCLDSTTAARICRASASIAGSTRSPR